MSPLESLSIAGAALALAASLPPQEASFEDLRRVQTERLVEELDELARWCDRKGLDARRDELRETVLVFAPDHERSRRVLGYRRSREGGWRRVRTPRPGRDRGQRFLDEYRRRRAALVAAWREPLVQALEATEAAPGVRRRFFDELLRLDPDDAAARAARGEERDAGSGRWLLRETLTAREVTDDLRRELARIEADTPAPRPVALRASDRALPVTWSGALRAPHVLCVGTRPQQELARLAWRAEVALRAWDAILPSPKPLPQGFVVYAFEAERDGQAFLSAHPGFDAGERAAVRDLGSFWVPGSTELVLAPAPLALAEEHCVRQAIALCLARTHGISFERGFVYEGFGTWVAELCLGQSRVTYRAGAEAPGSSSGASLLQQARAACSRHGRTELGELLTKPARELRSGERARCYALARYLGEGRPDALGGVLSGLGAGRPPAPALEASLGLGLADLDARLSRWVEERAAPLESRAGARR